MKKKNLYEMGPCMGKTRRKLYRPYAAMLAVYALFTVTAFLNDTPSEILRGFYRILTARSVLLTDYVYVGGIGAALLNSVLVGGFSIAMLMRNGAKPDGSVIMAIWLTTGFAFFGKNLFNMLPITFGVYLYSLYRKEPFANYSLAALLSSTLAPVVSGIAFSDFFSPGAGLALGGAIGIFVGFLFPIVSSATLRLHDGYCLYNMGFAGGLIATFMVAAFESFGISMSPELHWSEGNNLALAILLYAIFAGLCAVGVAWGGVAETLKGYHRILGNSGRLATDYYVLYGDSVYFNMGLTGAFATTLMLFMGCDLNGPTLGGVFTIVGFSAFGKHIFNILPLLAGAVLAARVNTWDPTMPNNTVAILFATGLAPISGQFGWAWGIAAGFVHVNATIHLSALNGGFNLYNNGFAAGFVAILLVPVIVALKKGNKDEWIDTLR
jgi:hypothetical protein